MRTDCAQLSELSTHRKIYFPYTVKHRRSEATIYGKSESYHYYRVAYRAVGKRHIRNFKTFSEAKTAAQHIVRDLADGSPAAALSAEQARDALAAIERLETFRQASGRRVSLLAAVSEFAEASSQLRGQKL